MSDLSGFGRVLLVVGLGIAVFGVILLVAGRLPLLGRLPGDFAIQRGKWSFYFPLATSILVSIVLTIVLNLFLRR